MQRRKGKQTRDALRLCLKNDILVPNSKTTMRKILSILGMLVITHASYAQLLKTLLPSPKFSENLNKIVSDFSHNFHNIQGEEIDKAQDRDMFNSLVTLPGSVSTIIYRFHSAKDTTASWQATMFKGDSYAEAVKAYKNTSRYLNKCRVTVPDNVNAGFNGKLQEPDANLTFAVSTFTLNTDAEAYKDFLAEVEMVNIKYGEWEVHLSLHNKKPDNLK